MFYVCISTWNFETIAVIRFNAFSYVMCLIFFSFKLLFLPSTLFSPNFSIKNRKILQFEFSPITTPLSIWTNIEKNSSQD